MENQQVNKQEVISETEQYRVDIYNAKRDELNQELKRYEKYCIHSRDLEHLLKLHNFLLRDSFKEVKGIFDRFVQRMSADTDKEEMEILQNTFNILFVDNAFDFYTEFGVRIYINVNEAYFETKEHYAVDSIEVIYKGQDKDQVMVNGAYLQELIEELNKKQIPYEEINSFVVNHPHFIDILGEAILSTLANHNVAFNTIFFKDNKQLQNATDFKKFVTTGKFKEHVKKLEDVQVFTKLVK